MPNVITNNVDFAVNIYITSAKARGIGGSSYKIQMHKVSVSAPNTIIISFVRNNINQVINWATYVILLGNFANVNSRNIPKYFNTINLYDNPPNGTKVFLTDMSVNFDIPNLFNNSLYGGF